MVAMRVDGLRKSYGSFEAVRGVSFEVNEGEVFALLGPNGAGKTTTVEILEGFRSRDAGTVEVLGFDPAARESGRARRERVGVVLQECTVEPFLTVREVLLRHARLYPSPLPIDEVIDLVGLTEKASARVKTLSGGQQRRLDVGLGIIGRPDLVFLDEPTTGFDPGARRGAWELVRSLRDQGATVLLTTHYMDEADALADRLAVIARGEIVAEGTTDSLGARETGAVHIRFGLPAHVPVTDVPVPARVHGGRVDIETTDELNVLHELTSWALREHHQLAGLVVERLSLEDVYLRLTQADETTFAG
jgi:ABC-2 type transport system ATP-binding protein